MKYSEDLKLVGFLWFILCDLPGSALLSCRAASPIPWGSSLSCCSQAQGKHSWHRAQLAQGTAGKGQLWHLLGVTAASIHRSCFPFIFGVDVFGNSFFLCCW